MFFRANGKECTIGCFHNTLENPPAIGSVVTVKHSGTFSNGTLRNAFFWRPRPDMSWTNQQDQRQFVRLDIIDNVSDTVCKLDTTRESHQTVRTRQAMLGIQ